LLVLRTIRGWQGNPVPLAQSHDRAPRSGRGAPHLPRPGPPRRTPRARRRQVRDCRSAARWTGTSRGCRRRRRRRPAGQPSSRCRRSTSRCPACPRPRSGSRASPSSTCRAARARTPSPG
jgi:hypothetical protein